MLVHKYCDCVKKGLLRERCEICNQINDLGAGNWIGYEIRIMSHFTGVKLQFIPILPLRPFVHPGRYYYFIIMYSVHPAIGACDDEENNNMAQNMIGLLENNKMNFATLPLPSRLQNCK